MPRPPSLPCSFSSCNRPSRLHGMCTAHHKQHVRGKPLTSIRERSPPGSRVGATCAYPACKQPVHSRELCRGHAEQVRLNRKRQPLGLPGPTNDLRRVRPGVTGVVLGDAVALVDDADVSAVAQQKWAVDPHGYARASIRGASARAQGRKGSTHVLMHRYILCPEPHMEVDHINGNRLDNRRCNLRLATRKQNGRNRTKVLSNTGHLYICRRSDNGRFQVSVQRRYLGAFTLLEDALAARDEEVYRLRTIEQDPYTPPSPTQPPDPDVWPAAPQRDQ